MNWSRAKTILIIFFICTNLFLLATIIASTNKTTIITDDIISSATQILKNNQIEINPDIIPRKSQHLPILEAENIIDSYENFSKKLLGEDCAPASSNVFTGGNGEVTFSGDTFNFVPATPLFPEICEKLTLSNAKSVAESVLKKYDFEDRDLQFDIKTFKDDFVINITKKKDSVFYYDCNLRLTLSDRGLKNMSGSWFYEKNELPGDVTPKSVTGVLIDFISVSNRPNTPDTISSIDLGYSTNEPEIYHNPASLVPCWRITLIDGQEFILSAIEKQITDF